MSEAGAGKGAQSVKPCVWLLLGEKRGDNAQVRELARLAWGDRPDVEVLEKNVSVAKEWREAKPPIRPSLEHIDLAASDRVEAPWPDLVVSAGRRLASVALHIKEASHGSTRIVAVGKPRGRRDDFDLILVAGHYVLPLADNVLRHDFPLMSVDPARLARGRAAWGARLADKPRPLTAVLLGGPTGGLRFDSATLESLCEVLRTPADDAGSEERGSIFVSSSRRTPDHLLPGLREALPAGAELYEYDPTASAEANPYDGLLALADRFVVTSDSASMLVEIATLGRRLAIQPLEREAGAVERALVATGLMRRLSPRADSIPAGGVAARTLAALGWPIHSRDLSAISRRLVEADAACWVGDPWKEPRPWRDESLAEPLTVLRDLLEVRDPGSSRG